MDDQDKWFKLMTTPEELHPDLAPYVFDMRSGGKGLNSPLVQEIMHRPGYGGMANKQYEAKKAARDQYEREGSIAGYIYIHERPYRFDAFTEYLSRHEVAHRVFWKTLAGIWTDSENIYQNLDEWRELWETKRPAKPYAMMPKEKARLAALPDTFTVYRGISHPFPDAGLSWTLDKARARWFAERYAHRAKDARVRVGTVRKADVHALFLGRNETEIVASQVAEG